jgi:ABC-type transport system substrate-binding protein
MLMAACGGGDDGATPADKSGLLGRKEDTRSKGVPGGVWIGGSGALAGLLDPAANSAVSNFAFITAVYSTLLKYGTAIGKLPGPETITGDAAESWEMAPGGDQLTLKLRPNHKFDARAPTNGRPMTASDVKYSWDRSLALSPLAGEYYNPKSPTGQIASLTTPDEQTVVIKLAFPYGAITELLAYYFFHVAPKEADNGYNVKSEARGSGPFSLVTYDPTGTARVEMKKNPDWYLKGRPFLDGMTRVAFSEYSAGLAQFETKAIWTYGVRQEDILRVKKDHPQLVLFLNDTTPSASPAQNADFIFSQRDDSPFRDVRLRRAASMLFDRDLYIETFFNVAQFKNVGLPYETVWNSQLPVQCFNWIDPRNKEFGEGAKYFQYDPAEAKKLIAAAGLTEPVKMAWRGLANNRNFGETGTVVANMLEEGFKLDKNPLNEVDWRNWKVTGDTAYSGIFGGTSHGFNDDSLLVSKYTPNGTDKVSTKPIPGITEAVIKLQSELDTRKRNEMIKQVQRDLALQMYDFPAETQQRDFEVHWPWLKNYGVFTTAGFSTPTSSGRPYVDYWYDASEKS